ncbi:substrate-binding periplasmic protein [Thaumasiovibrio subtropicus]|uniref:substrate-binding periplasmic protein n=1 Tax=Thaumasiovibrio subtropicus TaxID=1891207 RepID=UPI00131CF11A|nr:transporter substrate-binding domain-containing protein [Thaumasiovibrio subtropicus]
MRRLGWVCGLAAMSWQLQAEMIVLASHHFPPYAAYDEGKEGLVADEYFRGIAVDRIRCIFAGLPQKLEIQVMPWTRAQHAAKLGAVDGFFVSSRNEERDEFATFSSPIAEQKWQWYWLENNPQQPDSVAFKAQAIGVFQGSNMQAWLESEGYQIQSNPVDTEHLIKQLLRGRVEVILANNLVVEQILDEWQVADKVATQVASVRPLGVYFTHEIQYAHPNLLSRFNARVEKCAN